jgi:aldehyde:ferredoxin oxidoreductase
MYTITHVGCYGCPVRCGQIKAVRSGPFAGFSTEGPEYETTYSFGTLLCINYLPAIIAAERLCEELGLDTISTGAVIAFAMELFERGVISEEVDGLTLKFGDLTLRLGLSEKLRLDRGSVTY